MVGDGHMQRVARAQASVMTVGKTGGFDEAASWNFQAFEYTLAKFLEDLERLVRSSWISIEFLIFKLIAEENSVMVQSLIDIDASRFRLSHSRTRVVCVSGENTVIRTEVST